MEQSQNNYFLLQVILLGGPIEETLTPATAPGDAIAEVAPAPDSTSTAAVLQVIMAINCKTSLCDR